MKIACRDENGRHQADVSVDVGRPRISGAKLADVDAGPSVAQYPCDRCRPDSVAKYEYWKKQRFDHHCYENRRSKGSAGRKM